MELTKAACGKALLKNGRQGSKIAMGGKDASRKDRASITIKQDVERR
jgi:hypothetical protein